MFSRREAAVSDVYQKRSSGAGESNESGRPEIYVRPFVRPSDDSSATQADGQWQVSTGGGIHSVWRLTIIQYWNPTASSNARSA